MLQVLALIKCDGAGSQRSARPRVWILRHAQTPPTDPTRETEAIEPFRIVVGNTRGENRRLPRRQRQFAAVELLENRLQTFRAFDPVLRVGTLPCQEKAIKILG